jgi:acyl transferase domain-containing protein/thioesterase domain-containing protein
MSVAGLDDSIHRLVLDRLREWHGIDPAQVAGDRPLAELGVTSRDAVALAAQLSELTGVKLPTTLLWEAGTLDLLARRVRDAVAGGSGTGGTAASAAAIAAEVEDAVVRDAAAPRSGAVDIAVVGIGCRLPGGITSAAEFWQLLTDGTDAIGTLPQGRWEGFVSPDDPALAEVSRHGGFLDDIAGFDAEFFGIAPSEAAAMDPQQRLLLEVARESLDHAAISATALAGTRTGVFVGISGNEYARLTTGDLARIEAWTAPGAALSIAANRLSYALDLRGPSLAVDTACSSSLVAVHHAVRSLAARECDTALAGGVNVLLSPALTLGFQRAGALAGDGHCKTFDAAADGMVRAEGCAVIVLRRLVDAERAGDRVLAVIRASAVNSDGRSNGLLAPNAEAQRALLAEVYGPRGVIPAAAVDYVEAHGTGTALGDPVEAGALGAVLGREREPEQPLLIGSVKTNLGHLEAAAGVAGLVKTVLALHHGALPPQLHFTAPSPHIDFDALALRVVTETEPWPRYSGTATAGVSAFGFGGTNAHIVLQEYRPSISPLCRAETDNSYPAETDIPVSGPAVLALDAPTPQRLREDAADLASWLNARPQPVGGVELGDLAHTLAGRLGRGRHRAAIVARTREQAAEALSKLAADQPDPAAVSGLVRTGTPGAVWVFSGYGSQWPGMGRRLLDQEPAFAAAIDRLEPLLLRHAGLSLRAHLEPGADLARPFVAQPVLFALQVALAELWRAHGSRPAAVIGHSMGEVAAAVVSEALDEETGTRIIAVRSRLLDGLSGGAMAVVDRSAEEIELLTEELPSLRVAVHSSPRQCVVAGSSQDVERLISVVTDAGEAARPLHVAAAGHTAQVEPLLKPFGAQIGQVIVGKPGCRLYTTVDADPRADPVLDAAYWMRNLRRPVRFRQAVAAAADDGHRVFVEVSAHPTQLYPLAETLRAAGVEDALVLPTLRRGTDDAVTFRLAVAALLANGVLDPAVARRSLFPGAGVIELPSARWRHQRYWATDPPPTTNSAETAAANHGTDPERVAGTLDRLRACVAQVMGYSPASLDADRPLTELGLDSLQASRILAGVRREFGVELPPRALLRQGTISKVAALLDGQTAVACESEQQPKRARGVLPRDASERLVAQVWESITNAPAPGVDDELSDLIERPELVAELERRLGEQLGQPIAPISPAGPGPRSSTIADVATRVRGLLETPVDGPVRALQPGGSRPPLFLIHPAGGSTVVYRALVKRLGPDQPCFGLERLPEVSEVGEQAVEYARLIRAAHPTGPWAIGGWSYGGLVGQETARLLSAHGTVSALILIDSVLPLPRPGLSRAQEAHDRFAAFAAYVEEVYGSPLVLPYDELAVLDDAMQIELVVKTLQQAVELPVAVLDHQRDSYLDLRSGERHSPGRYVGRTLLYRATEPAPHTVRDTRYERDDATLGWDEYCPDLRVQHVPGHHLALLDPPVVDVLGALLDEDLHA